MKLILQVPSRPAGGCAGMTLIEMLISVALGTLIMGVALMLLIFGSQSLAGLGNYDDMNRKSRNALDTMSRDIRTARNLIGYVSNSTVQQLTFSNEPAYTPATFSYSYTNLTGSNGVLTRNWNGTSTVLVSNLASLTFGMFQRNPQSNFTFYATTTPALAKLITLNWQCALPVSGISVVNHEVVHSANIVIRNH
jgi:prepilin-type N-terminal cleavage/methylation domain-containing protein